ncbi:hypothetical protein V7146_00445 [Gottfriedia acidiceleris]
MNDDKKNKKVTKKDYNIKLTEINEPNLDLIFNALKNLPSVSTSDKK